MIALKDKLPMAAAQTLAPAWDAALEAHRMAGQQSDDAHLRRKAAADAVAATLPRNEQTNWPVINRDPRMAPLVEAASATDLAYRGSVLAVVTTPVPDWRAFGAKLQLVREYVDDVLNPLELRDLELITEREADFPGTAAFQMLHHSVLAAHLGDLDPQFIPELRTLFAAFASKIDVDADEIVAGGIPSLRADLERLIAEGPEGAICGEHVCPDTELLALGAELEKRWTEEEGRCRADDLSDVELNAICDHTREIADKIEAMYAHTLAGYRVKARALAWRRSAFDHPLDECPSEAAQLLNDLMGVGRWSPDAELKTLYQRFKLFSRNDALLSGHTPYPLPDRVQTRIRSLNEGLKELRERSRHLRATTPETIRIKAIMALDVAPTAATVEHSYEEHQLARSLIADVLGLPVDFKDTDREAFMIGEGLWPSEAEASAEHAAMLATLGITSAEQVAA